MSAELCEQIKQAVQTALPDAEWQSLVVVVTFLWKSSPQPLKARATS